MAEAASDATITLAPRSSVWRGALMRLLRNKLAVASIAVMLGFVLVAVFAPQVAPHVYDFQSRARPDRGNGGLDLPPIWVQTGDPLTSGKPGYWLGTDTLGRDTLSRVIYGARISIPTGFIPLLFTLPFGVAVGLAAGYFGGRVDQWLMRMTDTIYAIPQLLLVILVAFILRPTPLAEPLQGMLPVFLALALTGWVTLARLVRGQALALREQEFIVAAQAVGMAPSRIMLHYLLPNMAGDHDRGLNHTSLYRHRTHPGVHRREHPAAVSHLGRHDRGAGSVSGCVHQRSLAPRPVHDHHLARLRVHQRRTPRRAGPAHGLAASAGAGWQPPLHDYNYRALPGWPPGCKPCPARVGQTKTPTGTRSGSSGRKRRDSNPRSQP
jgi:ABC-type dipeptide/oligopeptide/nickel transport system permease subunit